MVVVIHHGSPWPRCHYGEVFPGQQPRILVEGQEDATGTEVVGDYTTDFSGITMPLMRDREDIYGGERERYTYIT